MRTLAALGLTTALALGMSTSLGFGAADEEVVKKESSWNPATWFGSKETKKKPTADTEKAPAKKVLIKAGKTTTIVDEAAAQRAQEESALLRRILVCDRLKEIALSNNDTSLLNRVEQLEERARNAYQNRTAALPTGGALESETQTTARKPLAPAPSSEAITVSGKEAK